MLILQGKGVYSGIAFGRLKLVRDRSCRITRHFVDDVSAELQRYERASEKVALRLAELYLNMPLSDRCDSTFEIYRIMLEDDTYKDSVHNIIARQGVNAEYAVTVAGNNLAEIFCGIDDEQAAAQAVNIIDVTEQLIRQLSGRPNWRISFDCASVVTAEDLTPVYTAQMDKRNVIGVVTANGYMSPHVSSLAQEMNIPAIISLRNLLNHEHDGKNAIADGETGRLYINPDDRTRELMLEKQIHQIQRSITAAWFDSKKQARAQSSVY